MSEESGNSDTIFQSGTPAEGNTNPPVTPTQESSASSIPDGVSDFIGEGKKYSTVEEALKSVPHAQTYIEQLKAEKLALEERVNKSSSLEEQIQALKADIAKATQKQDTPVEQPSYNTDDIAGIVRNTVQGMNAEQVAASNLSKVDLMVKEKYGNDAGKAFNDVAVDNGLNPQEMQLLASKSPKAFLKLFDITDPKGNAIKTTPPSGGSVNTAQFQGSPPPPVKSVMGGASSSDLVSAWNAAKPVDNN